MAASSAPGFSTVFAPHTGQPIPVAPGILRVTAPNAGTFTFKGTNSYIVGEGRVAIVDPGPDDDSHLQALLAAAGGREIVAILLTHTHADHCALVPKLAARTGAPVWSAGPHRPSRPLKWFEKPFYKAGMAIAPDRLLSDGERLDIDGLALTVLATPGHCANHIAFDCPAQNLTLIGDHLMGWNSTVVASPDGNLADYLASLDAVAALEPRRLLSGHGGEIADGAAYAQAMRTHRLMRNGQILDMLKAGPLSLKALAARIYPDIPVKVRMGATRTLLSHAEYLAQRGDITLRYGPFGARLALRAQG